MLYILGLDEDDKQGNKVVIKPSTTPNTILDSLQQAFSDKFPQNQTQEQIFDSHIFPLITLWNNRLLFLRLLESMLLNFKHIEKPFLHADTLKNFSDIATLFFKVLAVRTRESIPQNLAAIPYLNSSLFEKSALELQGYEIALLESRPLQIAQDSILRRDSTQNALYKNRDSLLLLEYLFAFLHAYNFTTTPKDIVDFTKTNHDKLINSAVLGLVFEKLNGYKEGSFFTPSFITRYMCAQSLRKVVVQKFNEANPKWNAKSLADIEYEIHREIRNARNATFCHTDTTFCHTEQSEVSKKSQSCHTEGAHNATEVSQSKTKNRDISAFSKPQYDKIKVAQYDKVLDCHTDFDKSVANDKDMRNDTTSAILAKHNKTFLSISICDPAVGSGHFLVSALNELLLIKHELGLLLDTQGRRLKDIDLGLENDELIITDSNGKILDYEVPAHEHIEAHKIQKALFHTKKELIENCLFGVDINPNSVEICKLRLWIELLKYSYYENLDSRVLQTLPNIDINIKCGNSLISRFSLQDSLKHIPNIAHKISEYQKLVFAYKNADQALLKVSKRDIEGKINALKETFRLTLKDPKTKRELEKAIQNHIALYGNFLLDDESLLDGLQAQMGNLFGNENVSEEAQQKAFESFGRIKFLRKKLDSALSGEEYKNAFEWRFEFPEVLDSNGDFMGFDLIIGNPPYIKQQDITALKPQLKSKYSVYDGLADIYVYFFELAFCLIKKDCFFSFITSNKWAKAGYGKELRKFLLQKTAIKNYVNFIGVKVFDSAEVDAGIIEINKNDKATKTYITNITPQIMGEFENDISKITHTNAFAKKQSSFNADYFSFEPQSEISDLIDKLKSFDFRFCNIAQIAKGSSSGNDSVFLFDFVSEFKSKMKVKNDFGEFELERELLRPFVYGEDIKRYEYCKPTKYLLYPYDSENKLIEIKIMAKNYPRIWQYLQERKSTLMQRKVKMSEKDFYKFSALRNANAYKRPKIMIPDLLNHSRFGFDNVGFYHNAGIHNVVFKPDFVEFEKLILGILNSSLFWFFIRHSSANLGGAVRLMPSYLDDFSFPKVNSKNKKIVNEIVKIVDKILQVKANSTDSTDLEKQIDDLVFELYKLNSQEIDIITP